ncbi:MAG: M20/M25/M40 family metallo-hydrolase [Planctomycetes bacterium]|nr:M20/M25/M40 family metallo-hydrolase [Planctomycetota bacterium]
MSRSRPRWFAALAALVLAPCVAWLSAAEENRFSNSAVETRVLDGVRHLASDELGGRGVGTPGIDQAAEYVAEQFAAAGLKTNVVEGKPFQEFSMTVGTELGQTNTLSFARVGVDEKTETATLTLGENFTPLSIGGSGKIDAPLVFVGYGITAKDLKYDDYAGLNVEGKVVIVLRHEPQQNNPHSEFNGTSHSQYAPFSRKLSNAYEHGAAAVIFVTDEYEIEERVAQRLKLWRKPLDELVEAQQEFAQLKNPTLEQIEAHREWVQKQVNAEWLKNLDDQAAKLKHEYDPLLGFRGAGGGDTGRIPVVFCRRAAIDPIVRAALKTDLATLEREIDKGPKPASRELPGWRAKGEISVTRTQATVKNVIGVLPGSGPKADETIVIGAHYDHLGMGGEGSLAPGEKEVHNGADDNASGTSTLIEVARQLAARGKPLPRRVVFIAFTGEERGLIGSAKYCANPIFPLDQTVAMLNMDMVGRMVDDKLIVQGADTGTEFGPIVDRLNETAGFKITRQSGGFGPSDHSSFYGKKIPVMHFFTGTHKDYHRPSDDIDKINAQGMRRVADFVTEVAVALAEADARPTYVEVKASKSGMGGGGDRPYFGSRPSFASEEPGYTLEGVTPGGPAEKGGLKGGDSIIKLGDSKIGNLEDFDSALRKYKAGDKVPVVVRREGKEVTLYVTLEPPR